MSLKNKAKTYFEFNSYRIDKAHFTIETPWMYWVYLPKDKNVGVTVTHI